MPDLLQLLWPAVEAVNPVFSRVAIVRWPEGAQAQLAAAELIVPDGSGSRIRCPECGRDHVCRPIAREQPDGSTRLFIPCPEHGRADVTDVDIRQWAVNIETLVRTLGSELRLSGQPADLGSGRVWRCGRTVIAGASRDVLFARGLARRDAAEFRRAISRAHRPIVFVGSELPPPDFWNGQPPTLIRLRDVATFDGQRIEIDAKHIMGLIADSRQAPGADAITVPKKDLAKIVRQQVKAEAKTFLEDDILVAAYRQTGSYRKAADLLNQNPEANRHVTKDRVKAAVDRAGGIALVMQDANSESVLRGVASQTRDRKKKFASPTQPPSTD